jgi:hypothetical protein
MKIQVQEIVNSLNNGSSEKLAGISGKNRVKVHFQKRWHA